MADERTEAAEVAGRKVKVTPGEKSFLDSVDDLADPEKAMLEGIARGQGGGGPAPQTRKAESQRLPHSGAETDPVIQGMGGDVVVEKRKIRDRLAAVRADRKARRRKAA